ncbi:mCG140261, partial [Mus musculus]
RKHEYTQEIARTLAILSSVGSEHIRKDPVSYKAREDGEKLLQLSCVQLGWNPGLESPTTPAALRTGPARGTEGRSARVENFDAQNMTHPATKLQLETSFPCNGTRPHSAMMLLVRSSL